MVLEPGFTLQDAQRAAISEGFVFEGTHECTPLPRRANLAAFLAAQGVNSLSALRRKLDSSGVQTLESKRACEGWEESVVYSGEGGAAETIYRISSLCENEAACLHIQGPGNKSGGWKLYLGQVSQRGKRHGIGLMVLSAGDSYSGAWMDDVPWGAGVHSFPNSDKSMATRYSGMFNGRPDGVGAWDRPHVREFGRYLGAQRIEEVEEIDALEAVESAERVAAEARRRAYALWESAGRCAPDFIGRCHSVEPSLSETLYQLAAI